MDIARWGLGKDELPKTVQACGGRFGYEDDGETPNTQLVAFDYDDCLLVRGPRPADQRRDRASRSATSSTAPRATWRSPATRAGRPTSAPRWRRAPAASGGGDHFANFVEAVQSPQAPSRSTADIEEGHLSSALCHLGNIAYRLGRKLHINPVDRVVRQRLRGRRHADPRYRAPFVVPTQV